MGFACPVCEIPQQDDEHLANHLALTALLHADDHETWLDEHVPEWNTLGPSTLAAEVAEFAPHAEYTTVFEDTTHDHSDDVITDPEIAKYAAAGRGALDPTAKRILNEARELTREMESPLNDPEDQPDE